MENQDQAKIEIPADIESNIKGAWIAGIVSICFTSLFIILSFFVEAIAAAGIDAWALIDVTILGVLTFGVYKRSRVAAVCLFLFFLANKILMAVQNGEFSGSFVAILFLILYGRGVYGTFAYHRWLGKQDNVHASE